MSVHRLFVAALCAVVLVAGSATAGKHLESLNEGTPDLKSAGALAFGPEGILFVGDALGAAIYALDTGDRPSSAASGHLDVKGLNGKIASLLGTEARQVQINDLAVNPLSGNAYLSVTRGRGEDSQPALLRVNRSGKIEALPRKGIKFAKAALPGAPRAGATDRRGRSLRLQAITDIDYADGKVFVAGLSNEEFASTLRAIPFPFSEANKGTGVKIFHGAHGRFETRSPVRTFVPYDIKGQTHLLAAYTCTPLVKFPVNDLKPGTNITGTTIAELGNRNRPLDMVVYKKGGKDYVLMANSSRGVMKITTEGIADIKGITERVSGGGTKGLTYDTIKSLRGVVQLAKLDKYHALILVQKSESLDLNTIELP